MARRIEAEKSKRRLQSDKYQAKINAIFKDYCSKCEYEPVGLGPDRCDACEHGQEMQKLFDQQSLTAVIT